MLPDLEIRKHSRLERTILVALIAATLRWAARMAAAAVSEAAPFFTRLGNTHPQITVAQGAAVEHLNGFLRFCLIAHFDKSKALRATTITVLDQCNRSDGACFKEQGPQIIFGGRIRQISYIQLGVHVIPHHDAHPRAGAC